MVLLIGGERDGQVVDDGEMGGYEIASVPSMPGLRVAVPLSLAWRDSGKVYARIIRWIAHCEDNALLDSLFA